MPSTFRGRYSVERILVDRTSVDNEESFDWELALLQSDKGVLLLVATLFTANERAVGQVLSLARIVPTKPGDNLPDDSVRHVARRHIRALYDTARRALASQAAMMDIDFALPLMPPRTDIRILRDEEAVDSTDA